MSRREWEVLQKYAIWRSTLPTYTTKRDNLLFKGCQAMLSSGASPCTGCAACSSCGGGCTGCGQCSACAAE